MEFLLQMVEFVMHFDKHLGEVIQNFGSWSYAFLFLIIFAETGLVVTPFLPGDSLLFVTGTLAARDFLQVHQVFFLLSFAAILGDTVNYAIGRYFGNRIIAHGGGRFFKKQHVDETHRFFEKHGGKTIVLARFVPIVRTFAPFVAGMGQMHYTCFLAYNVFGGLFWVALFVYGGYFFGNVPFIKENFTLTILAVMVISVLPIVYSAVRIHFETLSEKRNGK